MSYIVAIDGPAGSGKGTITKLVAQKLGLINIDTGAMYRCVTLAMIKQNIKLDEEEKIKQLLENIKINLEEQDGKQKVTLNGEDVTLEIRNKEVNEFVSQVSHIVCVRNNMVNLQRDMAKSKNVIMEGRDIGTNVFPDADVKIYLDATPEERAKRRKIQNDEKGIQMSYEEILENVKFRDYNDMISEVAPLKKAEDAIYIDSTKMTINEVVENIVNIINNERKK